MNLPLRFSLIVCTYMRADSLLALLESVQKQTLFPNEILIIDGSTNEETKTILEKNRFDNLRYFLVSNENRGLTRQRNFGISKVSKDVEVVCFLDDDTVLEQDYFFELLKTFQTNLDVGGVGGVSINDNEWKLQNADSFYNKKKYYLFEDFFYKEGIRNVARNYLGLGPDLGSGRMPNFSHGRTSGFPITGKEYEVDLLIGMSMAFRKGVVDNIKFSKFFEGYGLYEDADFSIRALDFGKNVINTKVQLSHFHAPSGRPNQYQYGKMVVRNGWYVWRLKNPNPIFKDRLKWNLITVLLILIRFTNVVTDQKKKAAFTEAFGRSSGFLSLFIHKPKIES
ncbi:glycosyl transferase family 2 [Flavobacterium collinsii]|uniref:glycosyltransferase family 2 protein n=1 Tax=Flavobacterium collinsii TaxID=1114861 RepID=UPI0022CAA365|nr:glycosyltransferase family 2 protein [Flavobacterium collinsii]GIQ58546.1 glycosyl transferase family 2 [Flavobacterium collinsii]